LFDRIHQLDCLKGMLRLEDRSIDMIFTDLPYGTTQNKWDSVIPLNLLWEQYNRIIKPGGAIVLTASQPFTSMLVGTNPDEFQCEWIWKKNNATGHLNVNRMPMKEHESVLVFGGSKTYNPQGLKPYGKVTRRGHNGTNYGDSGTSNFQEFTNYPRSILTFESDAEKLHPTQKPVALVEYFVRTYSNEGEVVLDSCMGSGTTAVACIRSGRRFVGFETDPEYFHIAEDRIRRATHDGKIRSMFVGPELVFE
jgi:site-specific DNA-methyltransferase (adenine-specific)